jgi:hypothetical protein
MSGSIIEREFDIAAIIALWFAIHGGDPGPVEVTVDDETAFLVAAALDHQLASHHGEPRQTQAQLVERLNSLGVEVLPAEEKTDRIEFGAGVLQKWCFKVPIPNIKSGSAGSTITVCVLARLTRV